MFKIEDEEEDERKREQTRKRKRVFQAKLRFLFIYYFFLIKNLWHHMACYCSYTITSSKEISIKWMMKINLCCMLVLSFSHDFNMKRWKLINWIHVYQTRKFNFSQGFFFKFKTQKIQMLAKRAFATVRHAVVHLKVVDPTIKIFNAIFVVSADVSMHVSKLSHISLRSLPRKFPPQIKPTYICLYLCIYIYMLDWTLEVFRVILFTILTFVEELDTEYA